MCISCCTNIVQCSAWNKARAEAGRQAVVSMNNWLRAAPPSASYRSVYPTNTGLCASESSRKKRERSNASLLFKTVKEIWVKTQLRIEEKRNPNLFMEIFPLPPPLPCGDFWQRTNRQSILSLQLLSIFRDKQKRRGGRVGAGAAVFKDSRRAGSVFCTQHFPCLKPAFLMQKCCCVGGERKKAFLWTRWRSR